MSEVWKSVLGYEGLYSVSNLGRVRSEERVVLRKNGRNHLVRQRILKQATNRDGYKCVAFCVNKKIKSFKVHRLVASAFLGSCDGLQVNHIDGSKTNNNISNLEWVTGSENVKHAFKLGLAKPLRGSKNPSAKVDEMHVLVIKTLINSGWSLASISRAMGISKHIPKDINKGKTWKHINV